MEILWNMYYTLFVTKIYNLLYTVVPTLNAELWIGRSIEIRGKYNFEVEP